MNPFVDGKDLKELFRFKNPEEFIEIAIQHFNSLRQYNGIKFFEQASPVDQKIVKKFEMNPFLIGEDVQEAFKDETKEFILILFY